MDLKHQLYIFSDHHYFMAVKSHYNPSYCATVLLYHNSEPSYLGPQLFCVCANIFFSLCPLRSFITYTIAVISVNFIIPLFAMFYCYYNVSVTMKRYKASNCLDSVNIDWSDQIDVTKASIYFLYYNINNVHSVIGVSLIFNCVLQMSIVMIVMFLVAWTPYAIVCLWASFGDPRKIPAPMAIIAPLFAKSSTLYNPCIYVIANRK